MSREFFTKNDCGKQLSNSEYKSAQLKMLNTFVDFCDANGLRYYLSGGTLLGAIRHKGFIPWDDDIDINMPRPDHERLLTMTGGQLSGYVFRTADPDSYIPGCQWTRLCNENIIIENYHSGATDIPDYVPLFLDIFPIDGFPVNNTVCKLYCRTLKAVRSFLGVSLHKNIMAVNKKRYIAHVLMYIPAHIVGKRLWTRIFQKLARRYDFDQCDLVGVTTTTKYITRERVPKKDYIPQIRVPFEDREYCAPANYDVYLRQLYGNYMQLPPKDKQRSDHQFNMYLRTEQK